MNVFDAIAKRRSIRSYKDKAIEKEKLERVLEAGRLAPSACNFQPWRFVVVTDPGMRKKMIKAACDQKFVGEAPAIIVGCAIQSDRVMTCGQYAYPIDVTISMTMMQLAAVAEGLGTCWIGAFHEDEVKKLLGIPKEVRIVQIMPIGYPSSQPSARPRKAMGEFACMEKWG